MFRVCLQASDQVENTVLVETGRDNLFRQLRFAIRQRAGFVENRGAACSDLFQHNRTFHNDGAARAQRNRTDNGNRYRDQQGTGRGNH